MTEDEGLRGIGISPRERLERIEALLVEVSGKLDYKADKADLRALEIRVRDLELHGTKTAQDLVAVVTQLKADQDHHLDTVRETVRLLTDGQQVIKQRLAYYAGGLGAAIVAAGYIGNRLFH